MLGHFFEKEKKGIKTMNELKESKKYDREIFVEK